MYDDLRHHIVVQNDNRFAWKTYDNPQNIEEYTLEELKELQQAGEFFFLIENPDFEIASEVGDVVYLCLKYQEYYGDMTDSMVGAWNYAHDIAERVGLDVEQCVVMKILRNSVKYPDYLASNGITYNEARYKSKDLWSTLGGDKTFYRWYSTNY